ncbi:glycosyltransferase [Lacticaseibacillus pabuli]|uniref:Glycosyltransferase n=1 Tax=Lacticaseibacillus pabuli TaxID=3025672 RepID=A0ABY7WV88_9LACO|nr:glycosyltransferase [Lacticaseibacillus sp. KACC 23028]WDF82974.1 glycosyltransferase [Lacticaseibacillus sp. KACC 23028]
MLYSVNENIFTFNSGTEFAAINRQQLFRKFGSPSQLVTRDYNPRLHAELKANGLTDEDCVNMYDYFQGTTHVTPQRQLLRTSPIVDKSQDHIVGVDNNESQLLHHGEVYATVRIAAGTIGEIGEVRYQDRYGNPTATDVWDSRGFKSKTIYYHYDGSVGHELLFNKAGVPVLEISHMNVNGQVLPSQFKLLAYGGQNRAFASENALFTFFLTELSRQVPGVIINDRPSLTQAVAQVRGALAKYQALHSQHVANPTQIHDWRARITPSLLPFFQDYAGDYDGLITPTAAEAADIHHFFPTIQAFALPDFADLSENKPARPQTHSQNVLYMGRLVPDKHIDQMVRIFAGVLKQVPTAQLQLMGYFTDAAYEQQIHELVKKLGIEKAVAFLGYQTGVQQQGVLANAAVLIQTSLGEAGNLALKEGLAAGLPEVAYRIPYGIEDVITVGENGFLIAPGDLDRFSKGIATILLDSNLQQKMHQGSLTKAAAFSGQQVFASWQKVTSRSVTA